MKKIIPIVTLVLCAYFAKGQTLILAKDIGQNIGKNVTICDSVYGTKAFEKITLLNIGGDFPNELFTVVVNKADEAKFTGKPSALFIGNNICVTGTVSEYKGKMQIVVTEPKQIVVK